MSRSSIHILIRNGYKKCICIHVCTTPRNLNNSELEWHHFSCRNHKELVYKKNVSNINI